MGKLLDVVSTAVTLFSSVDVTSEDAAWMAHLMIKLFGADHVYTDLLSTLVQDLFCLPDDQLTLPLQRDVHIRLRFLPVIAAGVLQLCCHMHLLSWCICSMS